MHFQPLTPAHARLSLLLTTAASIGALGVFSTLIHRTVDICLTASNWGVTQWSSVQVSAAVVLCMCLLGSVAAFWQLCSALLALLTLHSRAPLPRLLLQRWGTPLSRKLVFGAAAASLIATPATAAPIISPTPFTEPVISAADIKPDANDDVAWGAPTPQPDSPPASPTAAGSGEQQEASASISTRTVEPGDCLWSIAKDLLGEQASNPQIAHAWNLLYAENRHTIGSDPDLLLPYTTLQIPSTLHSTLK